LSIEDPLLSIKTKKEVTPSTLLRGSGAATTARPSRGKGQKKGPAWGEETVAVRGVPLQEIGFSGGKGGIWWKGTLSSSGGGRRSVVKGTRTKAASESQIIQRRKINLRKGKKEKRGGGR